MKKNIKIGLVSMAFMASVCIFSTCNKSGALEIKSFISEDIDSNISVSSKEKTKDDVKYKNQEMFLNESSSIYKDKDLKEELAVIKSGTSVSAKVKDDNTLDEVTLITVDENTKGYIPKEYLSKDIIFDNFNERLLFKDDADIYEKHDVSSKIMAHAKKGETIKVIGISGIWTKVQFKDNSVGYTKSKFILENDDDLEKASKKEDESSISITSNNEDAQSENNSSDFSILNNSKISEILAEQGAGKGTDVANFALKFVGGGYVWGGNQLGVGVDCSGFTREVYKRFGLVLPRTSYAQRFAGRSVSLKDAKAGDIVCFNGHVGMYIGNHKMVHASSPKTGIIVTDVGYANKKILDIRRILNN